ncbi:ABC-type nitrate/sulfonate/bicarbonate transport system, permease component [Dethiosulfatibacter aminovorans DSM 17477]|uniref:ABC-type nitrate/sulfonate/bicarbonate transport system, permease component n=1 Tax=Dethiosulfatibacter aminovorans DSM 17477 TaxID=1121476 RepID=A0A1M6ABI1_9FIRM|nr:ABC transporter permease [Dethiosulfatibacter aminovorans]SHI33836.1 ABC-type nitrate/sulfonate/bicarbonate transport system, permease component [Dethiosulfatibacter aminovorans DSM 17477]
MKRFINTDKKRYVGYSDKIYLNKTVTALFYIMLIMVWQILVDQMEVPDWILPSPVVILREFINSFPLLLKHGRVTIIEVLGGFAISLVLGTVLSILMDKYRLIKDLFYPFMIITQTVPLMALAPLLMVWFGFGLTPKIIVVVLVCFFPIAVSLTEGLSSVDGELIDLMRSMNATENQIFFKCKLPAAMPSFFAGLRIAATYSVMGAVISEWVGAQEGLGIFMTRVMKSYRIPALFADIVFIIIMTLIFVAVIDFCGKKLMPWRKAK